ncbi:MAG: hypothetical protein AB7K24_31970 [Gemmataceae bacterium]
MRWLTLLVLSVALVAGCLSFQPKNKKMKWVGDSRIGFRSPPQCKVQAQEAYELAKPHLERCFELRKKGRPEKMNEGKPVDYITIGEGGWYYIMRDCYETTYKNYYTDHAVRVHTETGELKEPS